MASRSRPFRPGRPITPELASGAVVLNRAGTRTLLLHEKSEDRWCFPKGHVDPGESLEQAALREIREETGLSGVRLGREVLEVSYRFYDPRKRHNVHKTSIYYVAYAPERVATPERMFDRAQWVSLRVARDRLKFASDKAVLAALRAGR